MVEDDGAEVTAVVVGNEVFSGVGALQAACSDALMLQQRLVQGKQHLQGGREREEGVGGGWGSLCASTFSVFRTALRGICHEAKEIARAAASVPLKTKKKKKEKEYNVTRAYNETLVSRRG